MTKHGWISGLALVLSTAATAPHHITPTPLTPNEQHIKQILHNLVTREDNAIITGHKADLRSIILPHSDALARAEKRARYLKVWATSRGLDVRGITISLRLRIFGSWVADGLISLAWLVNPTVSQRKMPPPSKMHRMIGSVSASGTIMCW